MVVVLLTAGGLYEFFYMVRKKDVPIYSYTGILIGLLIPISIFTHFEPTKNWELLFIVIGFLLILFMQFARQGQSSRDFRFVDDTVWGFVCGLVF